VNLLAFEFDRNVGGDVIDLDNATLWRAAVRPLLRSMPPLRNEQPHIRESGAAVAQIGNAEYTRFQALPDRIQRAGQRAVVADLPCAAPRRMDPRDLGPIIAKNISSHDLLWRHARGATRQISRYNTCMSRFGPAQPDLFVAPAPMPEPDAQPDPVAELSAMLGRLRAADCLSWADATGAMAEEYRALALARLAGTEGEAIATAILEETERLLAAAENDSPRD
jgi:hypothetical protein